MRSEEKNLRGKGQTREEIKWCGKRIKGRVGRRRGLLGGAARTSEAIVNPTISSMEVWIWETSHDVIIGVETVGWGYFCRWAASAGILVLH